jgi:alpha-1,3-rhamnosyl/mannosyltransferase
VIHPGLDEFFRQPAPDELIRSVRAKYRLDAPYFLYVGSTRPNKQLPVLIDAFGRLQREDGRLALAVTPDRFFESARRRIESLALSNRVRICIAPSDPEIRALYRGCLATVMATTDEGFGYPVIEAMGQDAPVIIARHGSLPELADGAALEVEPRDADELCAAMATLAVDPSRRLDLIHRGRKRIARFDWSAAARQHFELYKEAHGEARKSSPERPA